MTTLKCLIYGLVDPRTLMVRYVGSSVRGLARPRTHRRESLLRKEGTHKAHWILGLRAAGLDFDIAVLQESSHKTIRDDEQWWIAYGRASGWPLTNHTDGGAGTLGRAMSEENKAKLSRARKGRPITAEHRAAISAGGKGRVVTDETKRRMGEANRRRWAALSEDERRSVRARLAANIAKIAATPKTDEQRAAVGRRFRGVPKTPEHRAKIGAAQIGKVIPEEQRALLRAANIGKTMSADTRSKIGAALRGRKQSPELIVKRAAALRGKPRSPKRRASLVVARTISAEES